MVVKKAKQKKQQKKNNLKLTFTWFLSIQNVIFSFKDVWTF